MTNTNRITRHTPRADEPQLYAARVDVVDTGDAYELTFEVPGASSVDVSVDDGELTLRATVADRTPEGAHERAVREYGIGDYERSLALPDDVDVDAVAGTLANGLLTVTAPKSGRRAARSIPITTS